MSKQLFCGSSCIKYILENYEIDTRLLKYDMIWVSELALSLKKNGLSNLQLYCYNSSHPDSTRLRSTHQYRIEKSNDLEWM